MTNSKLDVIVEYSTFDNIERCICYNKTTKPKHMKTCLWHTFFPESDSAH
jgi:hypothetical protein